MSTYYKEGQNVVYRIAAAKITYEDANGVIRTLPLTGGGGGSSDWADITNKPAVIASGATQAEARTAITAAVSGANGDITSLTGLTTPLSAAQGGTGVATIALLANALNIEGFMPGLAPSISNLNTWTIGGIRCMTTSTTGRPTGTATNDLVFNLVSATLAAQFAFLSATTKLVFRVYNGTAWSAWQVVTNTAL